MGDAEELKALAEKLMTHPHPEGPTSIELLLRRLPAEWGAIPVPPGAELLGSALHSRRGRPALIEAIYSAEGDAQSVIGTYEAALKAGGWAVFSGFGGMPGGFVPGGLAAAHQSYRHGNEGPILMVAALEAGLAETDLRLRLDWDTARHLPEMRMHGRPEGAERLPALAPPSGVPLRGGGGGGGSGSWHSEATVETDLPVPDLEVHFSRQLEAAGWTRLAGTADDVAGWSSWKLPGEGGWGGILLVLAAFKPGERFLYVRIAAGDAGDGGAYTSGMLIARG
ncbi:MAG TPA: hypothetical protein VNP53_13250 [Methylomirabilota bacterium]|nr:hypothetical protein [Methylomirabilota bacterium]